MEIRDIAAVPIVLIIGTIVIFSIQGYEVDFLIAIVDDVVVFSLIVAIFVAISRTVAG